MYILFFVKIDRIYPMIGGLSYDISLKHQGNTQIILKCQIVEAVRMKQHAKVLLYQFSSKLQKTTIIKSYRLNSYKYIQFIIIYYFNRHVQQAITENCEKQNLVSERMPKKNTWKLWVLKEYILYFLQTIFSQTPPHLL